MDKILSNLVKLIKFNLNLAHQHQSILKNIKIYYFNKNNWTCKYDLIIQSFLFGKMNDIYIYTHTHDWSFSNKATTTQ